jgi:hypothetical protein
VVVLADVVAVVAAVVVVVVIICCCLASPSFFLPVMVVPCRRRFSCRWRGGGKEQGRWRLSPSRCVSYCTINVVRKKKRRKVNEKHTKGSRGITPSSPVPPGPHCACHFPPWSSISLPRRGGLVSPVPRASVVVDGPLALAVVFGVVLALMLAFMSAFVGI